MLSIYNISCQSSCGSYFARYLQSVTVIAKSQDDAIEKAKQWQKETGDKFIYPEEKWHVNNLGVVCEGVIDYLIDSDY